MAERCAVAFVAYPCVQENLEHLGNTVGNRTDDRATLEPTSTREQQTDFSQSRLQPGHVWFVLSTLFTPFHSHKPLPTRGSLQTAVSDASRSTHSTSTVLLWCAHRLNPSLTPTRLTVTRMRSADLQTDPWHQRFDSRRVLPPRQSAWGWGRQNDSRAWDRLDETG